jgi:exosortase/archaeosortase family protein
MLLEVRPYLLILIQLIAFYPIWIWYSKRLFDGSDEPWGIIAATSAVVLMWVVESQKEPRENIQLTAPILMTLLYAVSVPFAPKMIQAVFAVVAIGSLWSAYRLGTPFHIPSIGLLILSLPIISSLQFYLGYPMRMAAGYIAAHLLQMGGLSVSLDGSCLKWGAELVSIDAPCSGIRMLWSGMYLALVLAWWFRLGTSGTFAMATISFIAIVFANALRASALFYLETGLIVAPGWTHDFVGILIFSCLTIAMLFLALRMRGWSICDPITPS